MTSPKTTIRREDLLYNGSDVKLITQIANRNLQYYRFEGKQMPEGYYTYSCSESIKPENKTRWGQYDLNFVKLTGMWNSSLPSMYCNMNNQDDLSYFYIGQYKGVFQVSKQYTITDPYFFFVIYINYKWRIAAVGKFSPCSTSKEKDDLPNVAVNQLDYRTSYMFINKGADFHPYWPHYMVNYNKSKGSTIFLNILRYLHITGGSWNWNAKVYNIGRSEQADTTVVNDNIQLRVNSTSKPVYAKLEYIIRETSWQGTISIRDYSWRDYFRQFIVDNIPFVLIPIKGSNEFIIKSVESMHVSGYTNNEIFSLLQLQNKTSLIVG